VSLRDSFTLKVRPMIHPRLLTRILPIALLFLEFGCTGHKVKPNPAVPARTPLPAVAPPIETMRWHDLSRSCEELKAEYDALDPLVKDASRLLPVPKAGTVPPEGTSPITFIPVFGPLIAMGMDSSSRAQAAFDAAAIDAEDREFVAATIAHQRGHEAIDRRQYLVYLATQKGCR
jgi:hypothetical protein